MWTGSWANLVFLAGLMGSRRSAHSADVSPCAFFPVKCSEEPPDLSESEVLFDHVVASIGFGSSLCGLGKAAIPAAGQAVHR